MGRKAMGFGTGVGDVAVILQLFIIMQRYVQVLCLPFILLPHYDFMVVRQKQFLKYLSLLFVEGIY